MINDDTCALTVIESWISGKPSDQTFIGRIVNRNKYDNQWSLRELKLMNDGDLIVIVDNDVNVD